MTAQEVREKLSSKFEKELVTVHSGADGIMYVPYEIVKNLFNEFSTAEGVNGIECEEKLYVFMSQFGFGNPETSKRFSAKYEEDDWMNRFFDFVQKFGLNMPEYSDRAFASLRHLERKQALLAFHV